MKNKLLLGLSGLTLLNAENAILNTIQPELINKQNNISKEVEISQDEQKIIKDFYEEIRYTNIISSLSLYNLKSFKLIRNEITKEYKIQYELENEFKKVSLFFPAVYKDGKIERVVPIFYDPKSKELKQYQLKTKVKNLKQSTVEKLFPNSVRIVLNNPTTAASEKILFIESESEESMNYLKSLYNDNMITLKPEFKNVKVSLVLVPFNYYGEKNSLQISALVKEYNRIYGNIDIYLEYISDRNNVLKKIKTKYLEIFKENYANDFILEMYKEINHKTNTLSDYFLMKLIKSIETQTKTDIVLLIKKEQDFIENLMKIDFIDNKIAELVKYPNKDVYSFKEIDLGEDRD